MTTEKLGSRSVTAPSAGDNTQSKNEVRRTRILFWVIALAIGFIQAWSNRFTVTDDGLAYADMGDMLWRGDFQSALNAIWSPGYPFLLGLVFKIAQPQPYLESSTIQLLNVAIFAGSMASFEFFLRQLYRLHQDTGTEAVASLVVPEWAFTTIGYILFLWSAVALISVSMTTPDMLLSAFVYLAFGLLVSIRLGSSGYGTFALLGVVLGIGYLAKAPLFLLAFVFLGVAVLLIGDLKRGLPRGLLALAIFAAITAPWIAGISTRIGSLTFGKSGAYLYARVVNDVAIPVHWEGWPPEAGTPEHPTRKLLQKPAIFEFAKPVPGTYPPWQDIYYWYKGIQPHFEITGQFRVINKNARAMLNVLLSAQITALLFGLCVMLVMSGSRALVLKRLASQWFILTPAVAALAMYSVILVEGRYVGAFLVAIGAGLFAAVRLPASDSMQTLLHRVTLLIILFWCITFALAHIGFGMVLKAGASVVNVIRGADSAELNVPYEVARTLKENGIQKGSKVAYIGDSYMFYWARLAGVQINTELRQFQTDYPPTSYASDSAIARLRSSEFRHVDSFWKSGDSLQEEVMATFLKAGSKAVVTDAIPPGQDASRWIHVNRTPYYIRILVTP